MFRLNTLLFGNSNIHRQKHCSRAVNSHRGTDFIQRNTFKKLFHISQRINSHANFTDFTMRKLRIGIKSDLCRQVHSYRQAGLTCFQQIFITGIGFLGCSKACISAHRPQPPTIHSRLYAACKRVLSREPAFRAVIKTFYIQRSIHVFFFKLFSFRKFGIGFSNLCFIIRQSLFDFFIISHVIDPFLIPLRCLQHSAGFIKFFLHIETMCQINWHMGVFLLCKS